MLATDKEGKAEGAERTVHEAPRLALFPLPALIIAGAAFAILIPMFFLGNASGHDFEFHLNSWMEVVNQWKQGIVYPRWAWMAHYGYGEARFVFYPPLSWILGGLLGAVLPWLVVAGAYIWIALTLAGFSMFLLARRWLPRGDAIFVAALYAANPYHLVIVYWRSAFAELLASALFPLLLMFVLRAEREGRKMIVPLALVVAAAWLTNAPAAVMVNYSLALLAVVVAVVRRSPRILLYAAAAVGLGAALGAFYILPAVYEERWVNIFQVLAPGVRPQDNFLFTSVANQPEHSVFNRLISIMATTEMMFLAVGMLLSREWRQRQPEFWWTLAAWATAAMALMFPFTLIFWRYLPELRFVQLPWRLLLCLNLAFVLFLTVGARRWLPRILVYVIMIGLLAVLWQKVQAPWWDTPSDIKELYDGIDDPDQGYEGSDEYVPAGVDAYEVKQGADEVLVKGAGKVQIDVQQWKAESKQFTADSAQPAKLMLRLFNYPAWRAEVNGQVVHTETQKISGQMIVPVGPGTNQVRIVLTRTWDRTFGGAISIITLVLMLLWTAWARTRPGIAAA